MMVSEIVGSYVSGSGLSLRAFARVLTESLPDFQISHATIHNWRSGKSEPDTDFLTLVASVYSGWRRAFALDVLAAKRPEVWSANDGGIWKALSDIQKQGAAARHL